MAFQKYKLADNAVSNLDAGISASTTTATVTLWEGLVFPSDNFIATLVQYNTTEDPTSWINKTEKVLCTIRDTDTLTITRGFDGDTATTFDTWDFIYLNVVSAVTEDIQNEVTDLWSRVSTTEWDITDLESDKADKANVLELDNTTAYTPTLDYHPATKKFVEDQGLNINGLTTVTTIPDTAEIPFYNPVSEVNENITAENLSDYVVDNTIVFPSTTTTYATINTNWTYTFLKSWTYRLSLSFSAPGSGSRDINSLKVWDMFVLIKADDDSGTSSNNLLAYRNVRVWAWETYTYVTQISAEKWQVLTLSSVASWTVTITWT